MHNFNVFNVIFVEKFNKCILNIRRFYTANKNKVSIIIWHPTVKLIFKISKIHYCLHKNCKIKNLKIEFKE